MEQQTATGQAQEAKHFEDAFEQFGEHMEAWGEEFGQRMEAWAEELGRKMGLAGQRLRQRFEEPATSTAASANSLQEERLVILRMVEEGKISVTEAESLLRALGG